MLILALAVVVVPLAWLLLTRSEPIHPVVRRVGVVSVILCVGAALAVRSVAAALAFVAVAALVAWLRSRGRGGDDPGDDRREPPDDPDPEPDPGHDDGWQREALDTEAFDRARAAWEQDLPKRS